MEARQARPRGRKPVTALRLLAEIERDQRETGACVATTGELAQRVGRSVRQVWDTLKLLHDTGRIMRDHTTHPTQPGKIQRRLRLP